MKKYLRLVAAVAAAACLLGGCTKDKTGGDTANSDGKLASELTELTIFSVPGDSGKYLEEYDTFIEAQKMTNVKLKTVISRNISDHNQAFNILMASGELPDIVKYINRDYFMKYGEEGAFEPLEDLIDKYAPNIKKLLQDDPSIAKDLKSADGHIYYIPMIQDDRPSKGWFVRKDWLDKLGLEEPKNVEEYHSVLKAFLENDMNGDGIKNEVPYFSRFTNGVDDLVGLWDAQVSWGVKDGKVFFGPVTDEYKTAYQNIGQWYKEGLIDKEIYTRGNNARQQLFANNTGGSTHDWFGTTYAYNDSIPESVAGFEITAVAPPNGKEYSRRVKVGDNGWAISSQSKNKELAIKYLDFWFSEEGSRLVNYGIEGKTYTMVDGKPKFTDEVLNNPEKSVLGQLTLLGSQVDIGFKQDFDYEAQWLNSSAKEAMDEYNAYVTESFPKLSYTAEERKRYDSIMGNVKTYVDEISQKFVFGSLNPEEYFDKFKKDLEKMGLSELIKIQQTAYDRYMKN